MTTSTPEDLIEKMKEMGLFGLTIPALGWPRCHDRLLRPRHGGDLARLDEPCRGPTVATP